jgi:hypothetical protein
MSEQHPMTPPSGPRSTGRRGFFYAAFGGLVAALAGWISGAFPRHPETPYEAAPTPGETESRIATLQAEVARLGSALLPMGAAPPLGILEGEHGERVVFNKSELTLNNPDGVLLNLVATRGWVGFRFYKGFGFGNETVDSPWSIFIEGVEGYQGLAILRDWRFSAALWDEDGKLLLGRLNPHPPANEPARARLHVRGTVDEVQALVEASSDQAADVFQVVGPQGVPFFAVNAAGDPVVGSESDPRGVILHDTEDGSAYSLNVTGGRLVLTRA